MPKSKNLLTTAHASEIDWEHAAPVIKDFRPGEGEFVYFIGEPEDGPLKIGLAQHPIKRLRELQTGNPRRLRIERLIYGDAEVERVLHQSWRQYAITGNPRRSLVNPQYRLETEWFRAEGREAILAAADAILERQLGADVDESFVQSVGIVMAELGHEIEIAEPARFMAARGADYVQGRLRPTG